MGLALVPVTDLPECAELAWRVTSWLRGLTGGDDLIDVGADLEVLGRLRAAADPRLPGAGVALPVPGDPLGLAGPPEFNTAALEAGQALVVGTLGLTPTEIGWRTWAISLRPPPDLGEARRELRTALVRATEALADLDAVQAGPETVWRPELAAGLAELRRPSRLHAPAGTPPVAVELAASGARAMAILRLASTGGALGGSLGDLDRAARRAVVAACSADAWPPPE